MAEWLDKLKYAFAMNPQSGEHPAGLPPVLEGLAQAVVDRGMELPALLVLDSMRPLNFMTSELLMSAWPLVRLLGPLPNYEEVALALQDRNCLPLLARRIEELQAMRES